MVDPTLADISRIYPSVESVRSRRVLALRDYWDGKRRARRMPAPGDIDPTEIPDLLPNIVIAEYVAAQPGARIRVRYRLVGTLQAYYAGFDFTGLYLDEVDWGAYNQFVVGVHDQVRAGSAPVFGHYAWEFRDNVPGFAEFGSLPLSEDGVLATRCLILDDFLPAAPIPGLDTSKSR